MLDKFIEAEEIKPILTKYFVIAHLNFDDKAGTQKYYEKYEGNAGIPFLVFLDPEGKMIINSNAQGKAGNIGYPAEPQEIDWFMSMLKKAAPKMSKEESGVVEAKLRSFKRK